MWPTRIRTWFQARWTRGRIYSSRVTRPWNRRGRKISIVWRSWIIRPPRPCCIRKIRGYIRTGTWRRWREAWARYGRARSRFIVATIFTREVLASRKAVYRWLLGGDGWFIDDRGVTTDVDQTKRPRFVFSSHWIDISFERLLVFNRLHASMIGFDDDFRIPFGKGGEGKYWNINIVNLILCNDKRRLFCKVYLFILLCVVLSSYVTV